MSPSPVARSRGWEKLDCPVGRGGARSGSAGRMILVHDGDQGHIEGTRRRTGPDRLGGDPGTPADPPSRAGFAERHRGVRDVKRANDELAATSFLHKTVRQNNVEAQAWDSR